jgi:thiol-disulfide isomerase/thioredoxin
VNWRTSIVVVGVVALLGFLVWGLVKKGDSSLAVGEPVPVATLPTLPEGGEGSIEDYRGQWVLMNVWASWCGPCKAESPALDRFEEKNRDRIVVLGIDTKDLSEDAMNFIREFNIKYPQFRDASGDYTDQKLKTTGVPESFLIDPEGNLVAHFPGPFEDEAAIEEFAAPALESEANVDPAGVTGQNGPAGGSAKSEAASP